jgi:hypothetical protein
MSTPYRVPVLEHFSFQPPIINQTLSAAPAAVKGDRYIVGPAVASGDPWFGQSKSIAWYDGAAWKFDVPSAGWRTFDLAIAKFYTYVAGSWILQGEGDMYKSVYDTNDNGIVDKAEAVDDGISGHHTSAATIATMAINSHVQNTDQYLDFGGANQVSAAQAKEAYDRRGDYDAQLQCIIFNLNP